MGRRVCIQFQFPVNHINFNSFHFFFFFGKKTVVQLRFGFPQIRSDEIRGRLGKGGGNFQKERQRVKGKRKEKGGKTHHEFEGRWSV